MDDDALVPWSKITTSVLNCDAHKKLALDMAHETMTLLQNKNNVLPLSKSVKKIAVIGPNADDKRLMWGNYNGTPFNTVTILDGIRTKLSENKILYFKGCDLTDKKYVESILPQCSIAGKAGLKERHDERRKVAFV